MHRKQPKIRAPRRGIGSPGDGVDFDSTWDTLSASLNDIRAKNASALSFEQLYRNAYKLVLKKQGEELYNRVQELERTWLQGHVKPRLLTAVASSLSDTSGDGSNLVEKRAAGERLMGALKQAWEDHILCMNMTTDVLMYLDRVYCNENHRPLVFQAAMAQFRDYILYARVAAPENPRICDILVGVILSQIQMERSGDLIDRALIRSCVYMLEGLYTHIDEHEDTKLYLTELERQYLEMSRVFYRAEGQTLLRNLDAGSFCNHAMKRLEEESDRCRSTLSPLTLEKIKKVIDEELIKNYLREVINLPGSGVQYMIDNDRLDELATLYALTIRVDPKKEELKVAVQQRIIDLGRGINSIAANISLPVPQNEGSTGDKAEGEGKVPEKPTNQQTAAAIKWVDDILLLKDKFDLVLDKAFKSDQSLQSAFTKSFTEFINAFDRSSEYLSLFFDENMKKGIKGKTENEVDMLLDKGITLLRYIQDKDMFERYYKKHLSRRLLMKRSISMDAERQMISKMKLEVGNTFTQRIEAMFKDMAVSEDLTSNYKKHIVNLGDPDKKRAELAVHVLTSTMWPLESMGSHSSSDEDVRPSCIMPSTVDRIKLGFEKFYLEKHSGRKLTWLPNMGSADIRAYFPKSKGSVKTRELNVSTYAMVILLLFSDIGSESLTCEEIQARTNIPMHDLTRNLQSLAVAPKTRILIKEPMSRDVKPTDKFTFNEAFYSPFNKLKIGVVSSTNKVEDLNERKETEKKNNDARNGVIEAAIVRIMKSRKELSHQRLVTEVIQQLSSRFNPDVAMLKKRIESLIEREYLERVEGEEVSKYRYLA